MCSITLALVFRYLRPERTLTSLCGLLGLPDERSLYEGLEDHRTAIQVSLFHALCMSWPDQLHATLHGAISHSRFNEQDGGLPLLDGSSEHLSVALKQLFVETQVMYTQQALQRSLMYAGGRLGKSNRWFEV